MKTKPLEIQCLNIDCPRCRASVTFECKNQYSDTMEKPHQERIRAMRTLIRDSFKDWTVRKILRERNFKR